MPQLRVPPLEEALEIVGEGLAARPWVVIDRWLPERLLLGLRREAMRRQSETAFGRAGVGRGPSFRLEPDVRSDLVSWMDPAQPSGAEARLWQVMEALRVSLNRRHFLGLRRFEAHLTLYPTGASYRKHLDQFWDARNRRVSFILYLNRGWSEGDGGALRLYDPERPEAPVIDVAPLWGRAVIFFSDCVPHEVLVTNRPRLSATGWFRDDDPHLP